MGGKNWDYSVNKVFVVRRKYYSKVDSQLVVIYTANCRTIIYFLKKKKYYWYVETVQRSVLPVVWSGAEEDCWIGGVKRNFLDSETILYNIVMAAIRHNAFFKTHRHLQHKEWNLMYANFKKSFRMLGDPRMEQRIWENHLNIIKCMT